MHMFWVLGFIKPYANNKIGFSSIQGSFGYLAQRSKEVYAEIGDSIYDEGVFPGSISSLRCF
jgi:hypothetical protein